MGYSLDALNYGPLSGCAPIFDLLWVAACGELTVASDPFFGLSSLDFI